MLPPFDLCSLHYHCLEANVSIVVNNGIGDVTGVFDVDIVANCGGKREGIVGDPEG